MMPFDPDTDYYEILQVHPHAHQEVVKRAYRTIVRLLQAHPDLGGSHEAAVRVNQAYAIISNPDLRQAYDAARHERQQAASSPPPPPSRPHARAAHTSAGEGGGARGAHKGVVMVPCPWCGARNRVPHQVDLRRAICGRCRIPLVGERRGGRESGAGTTEIMLPQGLPELLASQGEVRLQRAQMPADMHLRCLRCGHGWEERVTGDLPERCPRCRSTRWSDFRLFHCRFCHHRFSSNNLVAWPYWLFAECPSCHAAHWHQGCENHPFRWMLNRIGW